MGSSIVTEQDELKREKGKVEGGRKHRRQSHGLQDNSERENSSRRAELGYIGWNNGQGRARP